MRVSKLFTVNDPHVFQQKLFGWSQSFREVVFFQSNRKSNENQLYKSFDCMLAVDAFTSIKTDFTNAFDDLKQYQQTTRDWIFGYLGYDLKNDTEQLHSKNMDELGFDDLYFFQPKKLFLINGNQLEMQYLRMCDDEIEDRKSVV